MTIKEFQKLVKWCKKQGLFYAKFDSFEFSMAQIVEKNKKKGKLGQKSDKIEGLVHEPAAAMPPDSEMLYYSTDTFDSIRNSRKDPTPRI